ncbi:MAG: hypothetical protein ACOYD3_06615 [Kiritimatiellia bacterium]
MSAPHWGTFRRCHRSCRHLSIPVDTCRYPPAVPAGTAVPAVPGIEDEGEMLYRELVVALAAVLTVRSQ